MRLLVSPSTLEEAARSLAADIIDVKRPAEGSLGANFPWVIRAIRDLTDKPVSAAIGDFDFRPGGAALAAYGAACAGADYIKVGLLFDGEDRARELIRAVVRGVKGEFPSRAVVIAAYADHARLSTISPQAMALLAAECGADVAMIDTGIKDGKRLFDYLDEAALSEFTASNRRLGLETALAGSLRFEDIPLLKRIGPDIIGVRGMVCGGDRYSTIRADLVEKARA
ncbi:MAG: (5-formylfuran-3-yl)methyl phosphate synthase, partial [Methanomicrobiales archaeon]|nr:(5-formylfuran-3-yl)methyl phosphate synthase [Methanomicrobiales archaeon]